MCAIQKYDILRLERQLRFCEYENVMALKDQLEEAGFALPKLMALIYRAGYVDGVARAKRDDYYKAQREKKQATTAEGGAENA